MKTIEVFIQLIVILGFGLWAYSKVKQQSLRDTFEEIKGLITGK